MNDRQRQIDAARMSAAFSDAILAHQLIEDADQAHRFAELAVEQLDLLSDHVKPVDEIDAK